MTKRDSIHVVFAGGGTGGHLFPGLAVAERLCEEVPEARITFAGSGRPLERSHVAAAGFEYLALRCRPLPRRPWHVPGFVADNLAGYLAARRFLRQERVDTVIGLGGYASVPMARAAAGGHVPLVLLEQNAVPGRATRWLARWADCVCLAFEPSRHALRRGSRVRVTGNPIRAGFVRCRAAVPVFSGHGHQGTALLTAWMDEPAPRPRLVVLGGSGGARSLNENVPRALARLGPQLAGWSVLHQAGQAEWDSTRRLYQRLGVPATVVPFIADMPEVLPAADLAVCRAGGTTLAELAASGVPAVLLPYPRAADDHQRHNAAAFAAGGGCLVLDQRAAASLDRRLAETLRPLLVDRRLRQAMSRRMRRLARPDSAGDVAAIVRRLAA